MGRIAIARKSFGRNISVIHTADLENGSVIGYGNVTTKVMGEETMEVANLNADKPFAILICDCHRYRDDETEEDFILKKGEVGRAYVPMKGDVYEIAESFVDGIGSVNVGDLLQLKANDMKFAKKTDGGAVAKLRRKGLKNLPNQTSVEIEIL